MPKIFVSSKIDLIRVTTHHWQPYVSKFRVIQKRMTLQKFFQDMEHRLFILQKLLPSHPFRISRNFETKRCQWYGVKQIKSIFVDKGNSGTRFGASLYYLK